MMKTLIFRILFAGAFCAATYLIKQDMYAEAALLILLSLALPFSDGATTQHKKQINDQ